MNGSLLGVSAPVVWPTLPPRLSFTALMQIEKCPRRYGLSRGTYNGVWDCAGYPGRPHPKAIAGQIVHRALEEIARARAQAPHEELVAVLRSLGGITEVLRAATTEVAADLSDNPRVTRSLVEAGEVLKRELGDMRVRVQQQLPFLRQPTHRGAHAASGQARALGAGVHPEVRLASLGWTGIADLLTLSSNECEIRDFKTGEQDPAHASQLELYALLWANDTTKNPSGRLATRLVVSYGFDEVEVPAPSESGLQQIGESFSVRREAAAAAMQEAPPRARPTAENCEFCDVRHLCAEYWESDLLRRTSAEPTFDDVQMTILAQHGAASWQVNVLRSRVVACPTEGLLRSGPHDIESLQPGVSLRVLGCLTQPPSDREASLILQLTRGSEVFKLPEDVPLSESQCGH